MQRDAIFSDFTGVSIYRIDLLGNMSTVVSGILNNPVRVIEDYNGDIVYTGNALIYAPSSVLRIDATGAPTTIAVLIGNPFGICLDPTGVFPSGDYVVTLPLQGELQRIDAAGAITTVTTGLAFPTSVQFFPNGDYAVIVASTDDILRIPRNGGAPTVFVPGSMLGNAKDLIADGSGGFYVVEAGGALGNRLMHVDAGGTVSTVLGNAAFTGLFQGAALADTAIRPPTAGTGLSGLWGIALNFPAHANMSYTTAVSDTLFPGISFGSDPRGTPLNPTPLFQQSFGIGFPGITTNWGGLLDGAGSGAITFDLTPFPMGAFSGVRVHFHVGVVDPLAPTSLATLSNVCTIVFP